MAVNKLQYKIGDKVKHILFGIGIITGIIENSYWPYVIKFKGHEYNYNDYFLIAVK